MTIKHLAGSILGYVMHHSPQRVWRRFPVKYAEVRICPIEQVSGLRLATYLGATFPIEFECSAEKFDPEGISQAMNGLREKGVQVFISTCAGHLDDAEKAA